MGLFAFVGDEVPGVVGEVILTLTSTGFAWGAAALLAGYASAHRRAALVNATAVLVLATVVYYGLILADGRRWRFGALEDGSSSAALGLASVGRATAFWLVASVAAGVSLGLLGSHIRHGTRIPASIAAGAALGLLAGEGLQFLMIFRAWDALDGFYLGRVVSAGVSVILATLGATAGLGHRRAEKSWPIFLATAVAAGAAGVLLWSQIAAIRMGL
ncbi:hypothetical protein [Micromonospora craterilacus]|uniref:hypothetical protein n=1 Tax=Micromonospora craterilacus TaxID=1655439 RepID=UPI0011B5F2B6|nr:hypothetical protein [Micromonospora craterilacus]